MEPSRFALVLVAVLMLAGCRPAREAGSQPPVARTEPCPRDEAEEPSAELDGDIETESRLRLVARALKTGAELEDAEFICTHMQTGDEELAQLCGKLLKWSFDNQCRELREIRDVGGDNLRKCLELEATVARLSPAERSDAELLCKEADASRRAREALDGVKKHLADKTLEVPFQCSMAVEDLEKVDSAWARSRLQEVLRGCFVEIGKMLLPARVDKMLICDYHIEQVYKAVKKYGLKDPKLDRWIARADAKCAHAQ